jgi:hypothetical protein
MADNKQSTGKQDRSQASGGQDYEVRDFAKAAGITVEKAQELIKKHGNDRKTLMAAAKADTGTA